MTMIDARTLGTLYLVWIGLALVVTVLTALTARRKVDSPGLLIACSALLGLFPPFNLLVLAALAMLPDRGANPPAQR